MKIYEALYNPMVYESGDITISLHKTKKGAEKAIAFHKMKTMEKELKIWDNDFPENWRWDDFMDWRIVETELLD